MISENIRVHLLEKRGERPSRTTSHAVENGAKIYIMSNPGVTNRRSYRGSKSTLGSMKGGGGGGSYHSVCGKLNAAVLYMHRAGLKTHLPSSKAEFLVRNSASSRVKMSFVT